VTAALPVARELPTSATSHHGDTSRSSGGTFSFT